MLLELSVVEDRDQAVLTSPDAPAPAFLATPGLRRARKPADATDLRLGPGGHLLLLRRGQPPLLGRPDQPAVYELLDHSDLRAAG
jgi:hypothetical protein